MKSKQSEKMHTVSVPMHTNADEELRMQNSRVLWRACKGSEEGRETWIVIDRTKRGLLIFNQEAKEVPNWRRVDLNLLRKIDNVMGRSREFDVEQEKQPRFINRDDVQQGVRG